MLGTWGDIQVRVTTQLQPEVNKQLQIAAHLPNKARQSVHAGVTYNDNDMYKGFPLNWISLYNGSPFNNGFPFIRDFPL